MIDFIENLAKLNRNFFNYDLNSKDYLNKVKEIFSLFEKTLNSEFIKHKYFMKDFFYLLHDNNNPFSEEQKQKIHDFQNTILGTTLYAKLEQFIFIYSEIKK